MKDGKVVVKDEVEDAVIDKYKDHKDYAYGHDDDKTLQLKR